MKRLLLILCLLPSLVLADALTINGLRIPGDGAVQVVGRKARGVLAGSYPDYTIVPQPDLLAWMSAKMPYDPVNTGLNTYTRGPAHGEGDTAFAAAVLVPDGRVILVPRNSDYVGTYDPVANSYVRGPAHGEADNAFFGGCYDPNTNRVIFAPYGSNNVGMFDLATNEYISGATVTTSIYSACSVTPQKKILLSGFSSPLNVYDPSVDAIIATITFSSSSNDYASSQLCPDGKTYLFSYFTVDSRLIFNGANNTASQTIHDGVPDLNVYGASLANSGNIVLAPWNDPADYQSMFTPSPASYTAGPNPNEGGTPFAGCLKLQNGTHLWVPISSSYVGLYDPVLNTYTRGPAHGEGANAFNGGVTVGEGKSILCPRNSDYVGIYNGPDNGMTVGELVNPWMNHGGV